MKKYDEKILEIMHEHYDGEIELDKSFSQCGINSITYVKIIVSIEQEFMFEFKEEDFNDEKFVSIQDFITYINDNMN